MYHPESDSLFEIDASELPALAKSADGQCCSDVTGDQFFEKEWLKQCKTAR